MDSDIIELQTRLAFQEESILELSDVVARQQREIAALTAKLDLLQQQLEVLAETEAAEEEPPPPHY
jgi:SlyX protein